MLMNRLLCFCIPTYNRRDSLEAVLKSLVPQVAGYEIPVYISDNNSEDSTLDMVRDVQKGYPFIFFGKQEFNRGLDINMLEVIKMSTTKYAWWLGDDDVVMDNAVDEVLSLLEQNDKYDFVLLNGELRSGSRTLRDTRDSIVEDCRDLFRRYCFAAPFGTLVVDVEKLKRQDSDRFLGTLHACSGALWDYLAEAYAESGRNSILVVSKPMVLLGGGTELKTWAQSSAEIMLLDIPEWFTQLHPMYLKDAERLRAAFLGERSRDVISLARYRCMGLIGLSNCRRLTKNLSPRGKMLGLLVCLLPVGVAKLIFRLGRSLRSSVRWIVARRDR
jgi:glycosyltransferase involved in cell wall biosynthesis